MSISCVYPALKKDTVLIKNLELCQLLLMNNAFYPWLILVPKKADLVEIIDLNQADQILLIKEIDLISKIVQKVFNADKLNIAALGNMVEQLHIHIIARYKNDRTFPKSVWVDSESKAYNEMEISDIIEKISSAIKE